MDVVTLAIAQQERKSKANIQLAANGWMSGVDHERLIAFDSGMGANEEDLNGKALQKGGTWTTVGATGRRDNNTLLVSGPPWNYGSLFTVVQEPSFFIEVDIEEGHQTNIRTGGIDLFVIDADNKLNISLPTTRTGDIWRYDSPISLNRRRDGSNTTLQTINISDFIPVPFPPRLGVGVYRGSTEGSTVIQLHIFLNRVPLSRYSLSSEDVEYFASSNNFGIGNWQTNSSRFSNFAVWHSLQRNGRGDIL